MLPELPAEAKATVSGAGPVVGDACTAAASGNGWREMLTQTANACEPEGMLVPLIVTVQTPAAGESTTACSMGSTVFGPVLVAGESGLAELIEYGKCTPPLGSVSVKSR